MSGVLAGGRNSEMKLGIFALAISFCFALPLQLGVLVCPP